MANFNITVAFYLGDGASQPYAGGDVYTIDDTGANIAGLSAAQISGLAANGIDAIDASDDLITLAADQSVALAASAVTVDGDDFLILSDSGANLAGVSAANFTAIAAKGFGIVTASDGSVSYLVAQYSAITNGGMAIDASNTVTLADTGANTAALTAVQIAALASNGVDTIDTSDNALSLTVAQFTSLGAVTLAAGDTVTIADTGANIATLTVGELGTATVDVLNASNDVISWTKAKYDAGIAKLHASDSVTLADTGANLTAISAAAIAALDSQVVAYDATDNAATFSLAQLDALAAFPITLAAGDTVTLADTQANIEALSAAALAAYVTQGVDVVDATDNVLNLTVAKINAVTNGAAFTTADVVTVADTGAAIGGFTAVEIGRLAGDFVDEINASDNAFTWTAAKASALGAVGIAANDAVTIADTGAAIGGMSAADFADLLAATALSITINASDNVISFTAAQAAALNTIVIAGTDAVTIADTGANIGALTAADIGELATIEASALSLTINASDNAFTWDAAKAAALAGIAVDVSDTLTISDTGANIGGLSAADIGDLAGVAGTVLINASDNAFTWDATKAAALGDITVDATDTLTVSDADIGALAAADITDLAGLAASVIFDDTGGNAYTLDVAKAAVVGDIALHSSDAVLVSDGDIGALTSIQIDNLADKDATVTLNDTGGDAYTLTAAKAAAVGDLVLAAGDTVTVADTGANLAALTTVELANLAAKDAAVVLDSSGNTLSLTVAQVAELGSGLTLTGADVVSILDTGANIAAMSAGTIGGLAAKLIDVINASDNALSLTVAQFNALGAVNLNNGDTVTLSDTAANIQGLSAANIAALAGAGVDAIDATDNAITFTAAQAAALGAVDVAASDTITISDTGANIDDLTAGQITILDALSAAVTIDASDNAYSLSVAQAAVLGGISLAATDTVTILDGDVGALTSGQISNLAGKAASIVFDDTGGNAYTLDVAKAAVIGDISLIAGDAVLVSDADIGSLTSTQIDNLADKDATVTFDDTGGDAYSLTAAQFLALGDVLLTAGDTVTLADTGANIAALSSTNIGDLDAAGYDVDVIDASDNAISLTVAQAIALGTVDIAVSDTVTIVDTGANIGALTAGQITALDGLAATVVINASDNAFTWDVAKAAALAGVGVHATDTLSVVDTGAAIGGFSAGEIGVLAGLSGTVLLNASDNAFTWTAAKASALGDVTVHSSDTLTVADTGAAIGAMAAADFTDLAALAATVLINASDNAITLTAAKAAALGDITVDATDTITIADTGANIGGLTAGQITALDGLAAAVIFDASDNVITFTAAQAAVLGTTTVAATDDVTIADTGANIAALSVGQITALAVIEAGANSVTINATDNVLSLTVAKYGALGGIALTAGDAVTMADTGANLAAQGAAAINALSNVDTWDATDNVLSLSIAQLDALADGTAIALTGADVVTMTDTQANIEALTSGNFGSYISQGVDVFDSTNNALNLTADQVGAVTGVNKTFTSADTVTVVDTGANIAAILTVNIAAMAGANVDAIDASDNAINLSVAQATALGSVVIAAGDVVTVVDTGANIAAMSAAQIAALDNAGVDAINASDDAISLTAAQASSLGTVVIAAGDAVTLADTGANIGALSAGQIGALDNAGVDIIDASDNVLSLTAAKIAALGTTVLVAGDTITLADTGANIAALTTVDIANLNGFFVDAVDATDNAISLTKAQWDAAVALTFSGGDTLTLADTQANIEGLSAVAMAVYIASSRSVDIFDSTDNNVLNLTAAQAEALIDNGGVAASGDTVTLVDTGANVAALSAADFAALDNANFDAINTSDNVLSLTVAQYSALGTTVLTAGDAVTLTDTGANIAGLSAGAIGDLDDDLVDSINSSTNAITLTAAQAAALADSGVDVDATDAITVVDTGANLAALTALQMVALDDLSASVTFNASDNVLSLTVEQYEDAFQNTIALTPADVVTLADTGANIAALTSGEIGDLDSDGIDILNATNNVLELTKAQYDALGTVTLTGADVVTLTMSGAQLAALTAGAITALGTAGIDIIDLTDNAATINTTQYAALGALIFDAGDTLTVTGLTTAGNDTIAGLASGDDIDGLAGNDSISGGAGDDSLLGGVGNDTLHGEGDEDTLEGGAGNDSLTGGTEDDSILGETGDDTIAGGDDNDTVDGGDDDDSIDGDGGDDSLDGGTDKDTITGGNGEDTIDGGDGNDDINGGNDEDSIDGGLGKDTLDGDDEDDTINGGDGNDSITGGSDDDELNGDIGSDKLYGEANQDTLNGGDGTDSLVGGDDEDELNGGLGNDKLYGGDSLGGGADGDDTLNGDGGNDKLYGEAGADELNGGDGNDEIRGGAVNDTINGGLGKDSKLYGEAGDDVFLFDTALGTANLKTLKDFSSVVNGDDSFQLDNDIFTAAFIGGVGALNAAHFISGAGVAAAVDADDFLIYNTSNGKLYYDADGSGAGAAVQIALVSTKIALTAADFTIIN